MPTTLPIAIAVMICLGALGDGSAGSAWVYSRQTHQARGGSEDSVGGWISCLERAASHMRSQVAVIAIVQSDDIATGQPIPHCSVRPGGLVFLPVMSLVLSQWTDLPPPSCA